MAVRCCSRASVLQSFSYCPTHTTHPVTGRPAAPRHQLSTRRAALPPWQQIHAGRCRGCSWRQRGGRHGRGPRGPELAPRGNPPRLGHGGRSDDVLPPSRTGGHPLLPGPARLWRGWRRDGPALHPGPLRALERPQESWSIRQGTPVSWPFLLCCPAPSCRFPPCRQMPKCYGLPTLW